MVATGLTRRIDKLGRIMIPIAIRNEYGIGEKDAVEIYTRDKFLVIKKYALPDGEIKSRYSTDNVGRIVLPKSIREDFAFVDGVDYVEFFTEQDSILLRKYEKECVICGKTEGLVLVKGKKICADCIQEIKQLSGN
ncbi:MAG: AbrB/MazE/SpoVT family DNA-binding domain-containing protein [Clostridia bacterium]|nr:AbrB/MazE/SpoVT family DNA-binding domain-containing protein [Clostridia bacterium]